MPILVMGTGDLTRAVVPTLVGKDLDEFSLNPVKIFDFDSQKAGNKL